MVAWHEMPGTGTSTIRPVGYGMIGMRGLCRFEISTNFGAAHQTVPYGTGHFRACSQAFHARLPSFRPSGNQL